VGKKRRARRAKEAAMLFVITWELDHDDHHGPDNMHPVRHRCRGPVEEMDQFRHEYTICGKYALMVQDDELPEGIEKCAECEAGVWGPGDAKGT